MYIEGVKPVRDKAGERNYWNFTEILIPIGEEGGMLRLPLCCIVPYCGYTIVWIFTWHTIYAASLIMSTTTVEELRMPYFSHPSTVVSSNSVAVWSISSLRGAKITSGWRRPRASSNWLSNPLWYYFLWLMAVCWSFPLVFATKIVICLGFRTPVPLLPGTYM